MTLAQVCAFIAGLIGAVGCWDLISAVERTRLLEGIERIIAPFYRARNEGKEPTQVERRRLAIFATCTLCFIGWTLFGLFFGVLFTVVGLIGIFVMIRIRRRLYRDDLSNGAASVARAMADSLSSGNSIPMALTHAVAGTNGAVANELKTASAALALGVVTEDVLENLRSRAHCQRWNTIIAAILLQRRSGGNLAQLLRDLAVAFEGIDRVGSDARAATVQARFTAWLVLGLPVGAALLMRVFEPNFIDAMFQNQVSMWLLFMAGVLQCLAVLCVIRLSRPFNDLR